MNKKDFLEGAEQFDLEMDCGNVEELANSFEWFYNKGKADGYKALQDSGLDLFKKMDKKKEEENDTTTDK